MKFPALFAVAAATIASADLTYNYTAAYEVPGEYDKYKCLTTAQWIQRVPQCIRQPQITANLQDGCAYDDFVCHCVNYQKFSDIIEPLVFPPSLGGHGSCSLADLGKVRPLITDMCNFMNATLYTSYAGCLLPLIPSSSVKKVLATIATEPITITY